MGYIEAKEDNIRIVCGTKDKRYTIYFPTCHICGCEVKSMTYKRGVNYTCKECKLKIYMSDKQKKEEDNKEVKDRKFENALKRIQKHTTRRQYKKYDKAISVVKKHLYKSGWFDSTEEIMAAIELIKNNIKTYHQVKLDIYRADFVLPEEKIVLEIDGRIFHTNNTKEKEIVRDNLIIMKLGLDWEVIRISDESINEDITQLVPAIRKLRDTRKRLRKNFNGVLPTWYSDRAY